MAPDLFRGSKACTASSSISAYLWCSTPANERHPLYVETSHGVAQVILESEGTDSIHLRAPVRKIAFPKYKKLNLALTVLMAQSEKADLADTNVDDGAFQLFFVFGKLEKYGRGLVGTTVNYVLALNYRPTKDLDKHGTRSSARGIGQLPENFSGELKAHGRVDGETAAEPLQKYYGASLDADRLNGGIQSGDLGRLSSNLTADHAKFYDVYGVEGQELKLEMDLEVLANEAFGADSAAERPSIVAVLLESTAVKWNGGLDTKTKVAIRNIQLTTGESEPAALP